MESVQIWECRNCGEILGHPSSFCSDECEREYNYTNRTCGTCGGEFWDGGTSCDCEDWDDDEDDDIVDDDPGPADDLFFDDLPF